MEGHSANHSGRKPTFVRRLCSDRSFVAEIGALFGGGKSGGYLWIEADLGRMGSS